MYRCIQSTQRFLSTPASDVYDIAIVGGGIIGCATSMQLKEKYQHKKIILLEKEDHLAAHQSGHNSGVLHAGIYYTPGSLKAKLCVRGIDLAYDYCNKAGVPYKKCGKLIVATSQLEVDRLKVLYERALQNKCKEIELVDSKRISEIEPNCVGKMAIWSPYTGIVDWGEVTKSYGKTFKSKGGIVKLNFKLASVTSTTENLKGERNIELKSIDNQIINAKHVITCGGLYSDFVSMMTGCSPTPKVVPFRGEYLVLRPEKRDLVKTNLYPVPDPRFPFLGVHFTPRINGDVWLGPNAVLAFAREGYGWLKFNPKELYDALAFRGMQKLMLKYTMFGIGEMYRSASIPAQVKQLQKFVPSLRVGDVIRGVNTSGVRAQALGADGSLVDDFVFDQPPEDKDANMHNNVLHVRNAPSPAATSSLAIAELIVEHAEKKFNLQTL